jgi:hypothetical protein
MHNPATAKVWQTAFGRDFRGMARGDKETGQKGTNAMFVMTHYKIVHAQVANNFFTYRNPVVNYRPQKEFPYWIQRNGGG